MLLCGWRVDFVVFRFLRMGEVLLEIMIRIRRAWWGWSGCRSLFNYEIWNSLKKSFTESTLENRKFPKILSFGTIFSSALFSFFIHNSVCKQNRFKCSFINKHYCILSLFYVCLRSAPLIFMKTLFLLPWNVPGFS